MRTGIAYALALGALAASPAWGQVTTGSASVSDLQFELIDLGTGDTPPALWWDMAMGGADVSSMFGSLLTIDPDGFWSVAFTDSEANSAFDETSFMAGASLSNASASTVPQGLSAQFQTGDDGSFESASAYAYGGFTLSGMTELRLSGTLSIAIEGSDGSLFALPEGAADYPVLQSQAWGSAYLELAPVFGGGASTTGSFQYEALFGESYTPSTDETFSSLAYNYSTLLVPFTLQLINDSDAAMSGEFFARVDVYGQQIVSRRVVSPVPEPHLWMTWLAGLLLLGVATRRRASASV